MKLTAEIPQKTYEGLKRVADENDGNIDSTLTIMIDLYMERHNVNTRHEEPETK